MRRVMMGLLCCLLVGNVMAQGHKKALQHSDYDHWKDLRNQKISNNGEWISYEVNPQKGDGYLYLYQVKTGKLDSVARGYRAMFSPQSNVLTFKVKAQFDTIRAKKLAKVKKKNLPKDSLFVWNLNENKLEKYANLKSYQVPSEKGNLVAFLLEMSKEKKDTTNKKKSTKVKKKKKKKASTIKKGELVIKNVVSGKEYRYKNVSDYTLAKNGNAVQFVQNEGDSVNIAQVKWFTSEGENVKTIFEKQGEAKKLSIAEQGNQVAFLFSADTLKNKTYQLFYSDLKMKTPVKIVDLNNSAIEKDWTVSQNRGVTFSKNGERLFFGVAPKPVNEAKDTLLEEEKYHVDVWNWKDPLLQPQQKVRAAKEKKRTWLAVYLPKKKRVIQLAKKEMPSVRLFDHANARFALGSSPLPYQQLTSWDDWYSDFYLVDVETGKSELILEKKNSTVGISPDQKFIYWFQTRENVWYTYNLKSKEIVAVSKNIEQNFFNEIHDMPGDAGSYGIVGWTKGDKEFIIKDRYDFWQVDPTGKKAAVNLTQGFGRKNHIRFAYEQLDRDQKYVDVNQPILMYAFHEFNKKSGYFELNIGSNPKEIVFEDVAYSQLQKAKESKQLMWKRSTFVDYPNLWISDMKFKKQKQISDANPQQKNYNWGSVELVEWTTGDGDKMQGMMYKPENFDPNKKYPMLVYFYERVSDRLHKHYVPQPNWSIINPTYCTSNEYLIFMPDINYPKVGYPGESAYSAIVTGTLAMMDRYKYIDKENIALQGQSWGGYQIAYLVTRTNLYKCAMAGAPVSNMTSAYGGIRWKSGMSRMFQYEKTQSRIGGTLWNSTLQYIENSPVFFAPKVETPLLIMHNDNDGAVPWYQGIEFFVALRRLQKPCWMLTYNKEAHNLMKRPNRVDLSIRMMQFFDHYLKGKPAPVWMTDGIPATKKGKMDGYELKK